MTLLILALLLFVLLSLILGDNGAVKRANDNLLAVEPHGNEIKNAIAEMDAFLSGKEYFNNRKYENWVNRYKHLADKASFDFERATTKGDLKELVQKFQECYKQGRRIIDEYNDNFLEKESEKISSLLNKLKIESTEDQRKSMACGEDHTLVVAGAGTGKTQTIWGKVAYLCEEQKVKPEEILLLSFTRKATEELKDRLAKIDENLNISTFHGVGYDILGEVLGKKPTLAFNNEIDGKRYINQLFKSKLAGDGNFAKVAIDYFSYYLHPILLLPQYETKDEYYRSFKTRRITTFRRDVVKSAQEAMIANFLYLHKIDYEYERPYKYDTSDKNYSIYRPDFYLPDYDIYLEHFGIDRNGDTHFTTNKEQNKRDSLKYREDMKVKREMHKLHRTRLVETYAFEFQERKWQESLTSKLTKQGVIFGQRNEEEVLEELKKGEYISLITPLIYTFLNLLKSRGKSPEEIEGIYKNAGDERGMAFMKLFKPIFESYTDYLKEDQRVDFNDMLLSAAKFIEENRYVHHYRHIIIDEFQDFSFSKYVLIKAMLEQNLDAKLFCVGDDWQSIFRFTGSDVNLMFKFEEYFGFCRTFKLEECHRFNNQLAKISNDFILKNKHQLKKALHSNSNLSAAPLQIVYKAEEKDLAPLKNILEELNEFAEQNDIVIQKVLLLGRYNHDKPNNLTSYKYKHIKRIEFLTIQGAKGLTCDFAIVLNNSTGKYGFPSDIEDDPLINAVLSEKEPYLYAEERRLMYVALTRARHQVFLLADKRFSSPFINELEKSSHKADRIFICSECGGIMKIRKGPFGQFWGCSNFPLCQHKGKIERSVKYNDYAGNDQNIVVEMSK